MTCRASRAGLLDDCIASSGNQCTQDLKEAGMLWSRIAAYKDELLFQVADSIFGQDRYNFNNRLC